MTQTAAAPLEQPAPTTPHAQSDATAQSLHAAVFSDPAAFLNELRKIAPAVDQDGALTPNNLRGFADSTADPQAKAAAEVALTHFDQLNQLGENSRQFDLFGSSDNDMGKSRITQSDLAMDAKLMANDTHGLILTDEIYGGIGTAVSGTATGLMAAATVTELAIPPMSVLAGMGTLGLAGSTAMVANYTRDVGGKINAQAQETQKEMSRWPEINASPSVH